MEYLPTSASSRRWLIAKLVMQGLSLIFCIVVIGLSVATSWDGTLGVGMLLIPISAATAAWNIAEFVTLYFRRKSACGRGIHPGAHVGAQLVIFLVMILGVFFAVSLWRSVSRALIYCNEWPRNPRSPDFVTQNITMVSSYGGRTTSITSYYCPEDYRDHINAPSYPSTVRSLIAFTALLWSGSPLSRRNRFSWYLANRLIGLYTLHFLFVHASRPSAEIATAPR
ncbi:uncharacterized protein F4822DRAFT_322691 [Hypoxylon trugodes]|uniref:uncharacterized protein n=1 Tax=Hypoxylon trugodes TaxID=326681 RepID=UPI00219CA00A|nr:uncharacterized protein F4822DRAFT_322691 [Hypoxylon trugodes]KAI1386641.1 hypothetical protein F4822DRAFT_322691 [Hypoxylon trugodes]